MCTGPMGYPRAKLAKVLHELEINAIVGSTGELDEFAIVVLRTMAGD